MDSIYEKVVIINGTDYKLASIKTGQMRQMADKRDKGEFTNLHADNIQVLAYCLDNAQETPGTWDTAKVEDLPWPVYKQLLAASTEISGFNVEAAPVGEDQAASPKSTGSGSTVA